MGPLDLIPQDDGTFAFGVVRAGEVRRIYFPQDRLVFVFDHQGRVARYEIHGAEGVVGTGERLP
jgi:hypothetical protein